MHRRYDMRRGWWSRLPFGAAVVVAHVTLAGCTTSGVHVVDPSPPVGDVAAPEMSHPRAATDSVAYPAALPRLAHRVSPAAEAAYYRGVTLAMSGLFDAALEAFRSAISSSPDFAESYRGIALVQQELRAEDEALAALQEAIRLRPDYSEAWVSLAEVLNAIGRNEDARRAYHEAIRLAPDLAEPTRDLDDWLTNSPQYEADPSQRLDFGDFSVLPPGGGHWIIDGYFLSPSGAVFQRTNIGKGHSYRANAYVRAVTVPAGDREAATVLRRLEHEWRAEIRASTSFTPVRTEFAATRLAGVECVMQRFQMEDHDIAVPEVFLIEGTNILCPSPTRTGVEVRLHYSQRHPVGSAGVALEDEVMAMFQSLRFPL